MTHIFAGAETSGLYRLAPEAGPMGGTYEGPAGCPVGLRYRHPPGQPRGGIRGNPGRPVSQPEPRRQLGAHGLPASRAAGLELHVPPRRPDGDVSRHRAGGNLPQRQRRRVMEAA